MSSGNLVVFRMAIPSVAISIILNNCYSEAYCPLKLIPLEAILVFLIPILICGG